MIPLLANQDLTPMLTEAEQSNKHRIDSVKFRLRTHGSGSILDLFSFRSDPYRSRVHSTGTDPTQRSTDVK